MLLWRRACACVCISAANGIFTFDIHLPSTYPDINPSVKFTNTSSGAVRFNPNL